MSVIVDQRNEIGHYAPLLHQHMQGKIRPGLRCLFSGPGTGKTFQNYWR